MKTVGQHCAAANDSANCNVTVRLAPARRRIVAFTLAAGIGIAFAAPGDLDTGFGDNGLLSLTIGDYSESRANSIVQQVDGKLVLAGVTTGIVDSSDFVVVRLLADGTKDATFGVDGIATADFGESRDFTNAMIQQSDGKLVLAGGTSFEPATESSDIALARFNADGSLDATFDDDGRVTLDINLIDHASDLIQQADGKLVIAGVSKSTTTDWPGPGRAIFARFNANGSLDTTFGSGGTTLVDFGGGLVSAANSLAQQADGNLVAVGLVQGENSLDMGLMRLTANGMLDSAFDGDGMLAVDFGGNADVANAVAIQPNGAIVVAGYSQLTDGSGLFDSALLQINGDGSLDGTFGVGGRSIIDLGGHRSRLDSIAVLSDNSLAAIGTREIVYRDIVNNVAADMILARFNSDGTLDLTFGAEGVATADFSHGEIVPFTQGEAVVQQADGRLVAVGSTIYGYGDIAAARFDDDAAHSGVVGLTQTIQVVVEATATVAYTVRRTGGKTGLISVDYETVDAEAQAGSDFVAASGTLTWNDGEVDDKTIAINLIADSVADSGERFQLLLTSPTGGAVLAASTATTHIRDVDVPGRLAIPFAADPIARTEGASDITVPVSRFYGSEGEVSVSYTASGDATSGQDFDTSGTLTWADGETGLKSIVVDYLEDADIEGQESFRIELTMPTGGAWIDSSENFKVMIIVDNDEGFRLRATSVSVNENADAVQILVERSGASNTAASVDYSTANGTAIAGSDYSATSGTLTWAAGDPESIKAIEIPITDDQDDENNESFTVSLSNVTGGIGLARGRTATVTIVDNDTTGGGGGGGNGGGGNGGGGTIDLKLLALLALLSMFANVNAVRQTGSAAYRKRIRRRIAGTG